MRTKRGRGGKSGDKAYLSADPGWNAAVGVKYALVNTAAIRLREYIVARKKRWKQLFV